MKILVFLFLAITVHAKPAQIILLRHAEKPSAKSEELSEIGYRRAEALPGVFQSRAELQKFGNPVALFAAGYDPGNSSKRAIQTMTPTARALGLSLQTDFFKGDEEQIAEAILNDSSFDQKTVVICWTHSMLPDLAVALGARKSPAKWKGDTYDRFWVLTESGKGYSFADLPQRALPEDSSTFLAKKTLPFEILGEGGPSMAAKGFPLTFNMQIKTDGTDLQNILDKIEFRAKFTSEEGVELKSTAKYIFPYSRSHGLFQFLFSVPRDQPAGRYKFEGDLVFTASSGDISIVPLKPYVMELGLYDQ